MKVRATSVLTSTASLLLVLLNGYSGVPRGGVALEIAASSSNNVVVGVQAKAAPVTSTFLKVSSLVSVQVMPKDQCKVCVYFTGNNIQLFLVTDGSNEHGFKKFV